jgi:GTP cyclohydrolase IA
MTKTSDIIKERLNASGDRYWAGDNISEHIHEGEHQLLIDELTSKFEDVLDSLVIDRKNDPNSMDTGRRLAKMYVNEIMSGRYHPAPNATAFPNENGRAYNGMLVVRSELKSMCSHHHQPVSGVAYIGIIPGEKVIGRGTLQEELANDILREIVKATDSKNVAVYLEAQHGCCLNRGIMAHSSLTQTTVLEGQFFNDRGTKKEFFDNIMLQSRNGN